MPDDNGHKRRFTGVRAPLGDEIFGLDRPLVMSSIEELENAIQSSIEDKGASVPKFEKIANDAEELGHPRVADKIREVAQREQSQRRTLIDALEETQG